MRLIDADTLPKQIGIEPTHDLADFQYWINFTAIDNAPTVEAIPVEWLEKKAKMYDELAEHTSGMWGEIYSEWAQLLREIVVKWRKENDGI